MDIDVTGATASAEVKGDPDLGWFVTLTGLGVTALAEMDADPDMEWDILGRAFFGATASARGAARGDILIRPSIRVYLNTAMMVGQANTAPFIDTAWRRGEAAVWPLQPFDYVGVTSRVETTVTLNFEVTTQLWVWMAFTVNAVMRATVTSETGGLYDATIEMFRGNDESDIVAVAYPTSDDYFIFIPGASYLMRVTQGAESDWMAQLHLTIDPPMFLGEITANDLDQAPGIVTVSGEGFRTSSTLTVSLVGYPDTQVVATDAFGSFTVNFDIDTDIGVGTYVLSATDGDGTATTSFLVKNPPLSDTDWPDDDAPDIPAWVTTEWTLQDPLGELDTFVFPYNPARMSTPHAPVNYFAEATVEQSGHPIVYEGGDTAFEWTFSGILNTEDWYYALTDYNQLGHRVWLQDHRGRVWTVSLVRVELVPHRRVDWLFDYTVTALIHDVIAPEGTP